MASPTIAEDAPPALTEDERSAAQFLHAGRINIKSKLSASEQLARMQGKRATAPSARECLVEYYAAEAELERMLKLKPRPSFNKVRQIKL